MRSTEILSLGAVLDFKNKKKRTATKEKKRWLGELPTKCDICKGELTNGFVDGKTIWGPWAIMCFGCYWEKGVGLGLGKGQHYDREGVKIYG